MTKTTLTNEEVKTLAKTAMEIRFRCRLATKDQRNGYEAGWYEGYLAAREIWSA